jgi:HAD superfamily phosphoserine phosphatase-like hydrolase
MPLAFLCDFDGTVSREDIGAEFVRRFGTGDQGGLERALERWRAGEIGHRELTEVECGRLSVTEEEAVAFARGFALDPRFAPFAESALARGHAVLVVSEGFDFYIADHLRRADLADVPFAANRLRFERGRTVPEFPYADSSCGRCGNCKGARARDQRRLGYEVVMIGDGLSDRCGARAADWVVARSDLLDWCRREGIPAEPFEDFGDVARYASRLDPALAMDGEGR